MAQMKTFFVVVVFVFIVLIGSHKKKLILFSIQFFCLELICFRILTFIECRNSIFGISNQGAKRQNVKKIDCILRYKKTKNARCVVPLYFE